eukprot:363625-Chlamydomonas_euryale.AAC.8
MSLQLDETIAEMTERKALKMGAPGSLATLSFSDFASEGLRLRSDMQRAVEDERCVATACLQVYLHFAAPTADVDMSLVRFPRLGHPTHAMLCTCRYEDAAKVKTLLAELEMESKRAQV